MKLLALLRRWLTQPYEVPVAQSSEFDRRLTESREARTRVSARHEEFERELEKSLRPQEHQS